MSTLTTWCPHCDKINDYLVWVVFDHKIIPKRYPSEGELSNPCCEQWDKTVVCRCEDCDVTWVEEDLPWHIRMCLHPWL